MLHPEIPSNCEWAPQLCTPSLQWYKACPQRLALRGSPWKVSRMPPPTVYVNVESCYHPALLWALCLIFPGSFLLNSVTPSKLPSVTVFSFVRRNQNATYLVGCHLSDSYGIFSDDSGSGCVSVHPPGRPSAG